MTRPCGCGMQRGGDSEKGYDVDIMMMMTTMIMMLIVMMLI